MVKAKENKEEQANVENKSKVKPFAFKLFLAMVVAGGVYGAWKHPEIIDKLRGSLETPQPKPVLSEEVSKPDDLMLQTIRNLSNQVNYLMNRKSDVNAADFNEQIEMLENRNNTALKAKADVSLVLGVVSRLDKLEAQVDKLSKVTDNSAVVLTAAMLVKDAAERGGSFEYEADVFKQIAGNSPEIRQETAVIEKYAPKGIFPDYYLVEEFGKVYEALVNEEKAAFEQNWKERINSKLSEYIKVKRVNAEEPEFKADSDLERIKAVVDAGNIKKAIFEIESLSNQQLLNNFKLKEWLEHAKANVAFNDAISKISMHYLAVMKVNFIKKDSGND